jgi:signal recognition particle receptor subunit beta
LLKQEVKKYMFNLIQLKKLAGATLLVLCNKQDINGALKVSEIKDVSIYIIDINKFSFIFRS